MVYFEGGDRITLYATSLGLDGELGQKPLYFYAGHILHML